MNKAFTQTQLDHILEFVGYGRLDADIWFVIMNESSANEERIRAMLKFDYVDDLGKNLAIASDTAPFSGMRGMCEIMLRLDDKVPTEDAQKAYQSEHLGRFHGASLICSLMPIPTTADESVVNTLFPQYPSHKAFYEAVKSDRFGLFEQLIDENRPKIIIGCGREYWSEYQELFNQFKFSEHDQFLLGWNADTVVILSDDLDAPEMQDKFADIVALIRENALSIDAGIHSDTPVLSESEVKRQKKAAARQAAVAKRKPSATHDPADPYCVCAYCLKYEGVK